MSKVFRSLNLLIISAYSHSRQKKSSFPNTSHCLITIQSVVRLIMWSGSQITCFSVFFLLHFWGRGLVLFKVTSEDAFVDKAYISLRIYLYICILSFAFFLTKGKSRKSNNHWQYLFLCRQKGDTLFKLTIKKKKSQVLQDYVQVCCHTC